MENNFEYLAVIAGGIGEDVWDREITIIAESMLEAVDNITINLYDGEDIISIERVD